MKLRQSQTGTGQASGLWPVLLILLAAVLVPTGCVLWFMTAAIRNEHLAVRQRITDVYRRQLIDTQDRLDTFWAAKLKALDNARQLPAAERFKTLTTNGTADTVVVYDESGQLAYPQPSNDLALTEVIDPTWQQAQSLERNADYPAAIEAYDKIANQETDPNYQARAWQAKARCLALAGRQAEAVAGTLSKPVYRNARDPWGRLIAPDALMYALQISPTRDDRAWQTTAEDLANRLNSYKPPVMPSAQRRFLMLEFQQEIGIPMPTLKAEQLADEYIEAELDRPTGAGLRRAQPVNLWTLPSSDGRAVAMWTEDSLAEAIVSSQPDPASLVGAELVTHYQSAPDNTKKPFLSIPVGSSMPDWHISLYLDDSELFTTAARRQKAIYLWTGGAGVLLIVVFSMTVAAYVSRQIKLTRLKNDLIATVSHELKTPLASMRVLVDTMREGRTKDAQQDQEYLGLIARENERLSRLIDNFLTFSRMERNKRAFEFTRVDMGDIIQAAVDALSERLTPPQAQLEMEVAGDLPKVLADRTAMTTVILNLLDNALKYSGDHKALKIAAHSTGNHVRIDVSDNGVGMSRRATKRIFDKFYQVDQTLSRKAGGCGLGLSIVMFILKAHGGTIDVRSQVGKGSTFTVQLPTANAQESAQ